MRGLTSPDLKPDGLAGGGKVRGGGLNMREKKEGMKGWKQNISAENAKVENRGIRKENCDAVVLQEKPDTREKRGGGGEQYTSGMTRREQTPADNDLGYRSWTVTRKKQKRKKVENDLLLTTEKKNKVMIRKKISSREGVVATRTAVPAGVLQADEENRSGKEKKKGGIWKKKQKKKNKAKFAGERRRTSRTRIL